MTCRNHPVRSSAPKRPDTKRSDVTDGCNTGNGYNRRVMEFRLKFGTSFLAALLTANCAVWAQTVTTVAGNGSPGFSGDGGPAIPAEINNTVYVAADLFGNLHLAYQND